MEILENPDSAKIGGVPIPYPAGLSDTIWIAVQPIKEFVSRENAVDTWKQVGQMLVHIGEYERDGIRRIWEQTFGNQN